MRRSFSGAHPFRPQCLVTALEPSSDPKGEALVERATHLVGEIDRGRCPRCGGPLSTASGLPAGSRVTACRCVPICGSCGAHEALFGGQAVQWASERFTPESVTADLERASAKATTVIAMIIKDDEGMKMLDNSGVWPVELRPHPGGWLEFGYDDSPDRDELER
jgi:hypothetical protein